MPFLFPPLQSLRMSIRFDISATAGRGRRGRLITPHGVVETPVFMPVGTAATVKAVPQDVLEELGVEILLGNTYHLYLRPGIEQVRSLGGLHRFMAWPRAILTDSGGFQVFSLSGLTKVTEEGVRFRSHLDGASHFFTPERAMQAQIGLGADIMMAFDECTEYPADAVRTRASMEMTLRWAARSKKYFEEHQHEVPWDFDRVGADAPSASSGQALVRPAERSSASPSVGSSPAESRFPFDSFPSVSRSGQALDSGFDSLRESKSSARNDNALLGVGENCTQALFGIVQGGMDLALRKESALRTIEIGFDGYAIGGLSVGEPRARTREVVEATLEHLPRDKPRYLMGVGTPEEIVEYSKLGVDMMDCVLPTRAARHGLLFTSEGRVSIKQARYAGDEGALDPNCGCRTCRRYSRAYLRHLYASNEVLAQVLLTVHNLTFYLDEMRRVRHSIGLGESALFLSGEQAEGNS
jgi:queuine tRNA-ribosyltransferase